MDQELKDALEQLKQDVKGSNAQEVKRSEGAKLKIFFLS